MMQQSMENNRQYWVNTDEISSLLTKGNKEEERERYYEGDTASFEDAFAAILDLLWRCRNVTTWKVWNTGIQRGLEIVSAVYAFLNDLISDASIERCNCECYSFGKRNGELEPEEN